MLGLAASSILALVASASATAAVRYAGPGGTSPADHCEDPAHPCSLFNAADQGATGTTLTRGDEVIVEPGVYTASAGDLGSFNHITLPLGISVRGAAGGPRPVIKLDEPPGFFGAIFVRDEDSVSNLEIDATAGIQNGIFVEGGLVDNLIVKSSSSVFGATGCFQLGGTIRDTVCLATGAGATALGSGDVGFRAGTQRAAVLRNVTAVATGPGSLGLNFTVIGESTFNVSGIAVLAQGTKKDVVAASLSLAPNTPGTAGDVEVALDHSDYATTSAETDAAGGTASVTGAGSGTNIMEAPLFVADGFHERPDSPTRDAGAVDALSGATDIDEQPRLIGVAPDIGADEFARGTRTALDCAPSTLLPGTASTCTATFENDPANPIAPSGIVEFLSDQPGSFSENGTCLLNDEGGGKASCRLTYTPSQVGTGTHKITASYRGDPEHAPTLASTQVRVSAAPTATTLDCSPSGLLLGASGTACTATVSDISTSPEPTSGTVKFASDGQGSFGSGASCALAPVGGGKASCRLTYTPSQVGTGTHKITASYQGNGRDGQSQGSAQVSVTAPAKASRQAPNTTLKKRPRKKTARRLAKFTFGSDQGGSTFQCKLDRRAFRPCRSPFKVKVKVGRHTFSVQAVNQSGIADPTPATFHWKVLRDRGLRR